MRRKRASKGPSILEVFREPRLRSKAVARAGAAYNHSMAFFFTYHVAELHKSFEALVRFFYDVRRNFQFLRFSEYDDGRCAEEKITFFFAPSENRSVRLNDLSHAE